MRSAEESAARFLEHRPRTKKEMIDHLFSKGHDQNDIDEVITMLENSRYLDDSAYALMYIGYAFGKGRSFNRIKRELRNKGVSDDDIFKAKCGYEDEHDTDIDATEIERASAQAEKYFAASRPLDKRSVAALQRKLAGLGYSSSTISAVSFPLYDRISGQGEYHD